MNNAGYGTFRGVIEVKTLIKKDGKTPVPAVVRKHTRVYNLAGTAKGQLTLLARRYPQTHIIDRYVEQAVKWERVD